MIPTKLYPYLINQNENIIWIEIGKNFINNKINTYNGAPYIACVYNDLKNSTCTKENECNILDLMEKQLTKSDQIIIGGDLVE